MTFYRKFGGIETDGKTQELINPEKGEIPLQGFMNVPSCLLPK